MIPKLTIIVSPPRCGSMWLYNAARLIHQQGGLTPKPDEVAVGLDEIARTTQRAALDVDPSIVFVVKAHAVIGGVGDGVFGATVLRDPRDMVVSLARFMGRDALADDAAFVVDQMISVYKRLDDVWEGQVHKARYVDIVERPAMVVAALRAALRHAPDAAGDAAVAAALAPDAVARIVAAAEREDGDSIGLQDYDVDRRMDRRTGFQSGHIGDRATGKWRGAIPAAALAQINAAHGEWLSAHDFPLA